MSRTVNKEMTVYEGFVRVFQSSSSR